MIRNFILLFITLALSVGILWVALTSLDPLGAQSSIAYISFFLGVFGFCLSFGTLAFFFGTEIVLWRRLGHRAYATALRRGLLLSLFCTSLLILQMLRLLSLFEAITIACFLGVVEWIALTTRRH